MVEIAGKQHTLRVGDAPASVGASGAPGSGATQVVLTAGDRGRLPPGQINGRSVQMVVDTGASSVAISVADAERLGLAYKGGPTGRVSTANGLVQAWRAAGSGACVGDVVVYGVDGVVYRPAPCPMCCWATRF